MSTGRILTTTTTRAASLRLAEWLNSPNAKGHPATRLVEAAKGLSNAFEHRERFDADKVDKYIREIDRIALQFPGVGEVLGADLMREGFQFAFRPLGRSRRAIDGWGVVNDVRILAEAGALWRICHCALPSCKRAFAAKFPHQAFHNTKCKQKHKRSSPEYKEHQRLKAAEDYRKSLPPWARKKLDAKRARRQKNVDHLPAS
jgi:hypothetical protein